MNPTDDHPAWHVMTDSEYEAKNLLWQEWVKAQRIADEWQALINRQTTPTNKETGS